MNFKKVPSWVWWFCLTSCILFVGVAGIYTVTQQEVHNARIAAWDLEQKAKRARAAELSKQGYDIILRQRRDELRALCREQGNIPLQFWDKFVCVKPDAIAWEKFDPKPEQMQ